ncbi:hypothetical protein Clacol_003504 [Clathrus columnatus]|uniref:Uncharacterized protein n=1 Tax=Clathrus columnatus TaxID=1419009 RepID=A0AAV5A701_9AGAM|nr:hypothetical protein Clacol_003504 [Clathrus columnatus]
MPPKKRGSTSSTRPSTRSKRDAVDTTLIIQVRALQSSDQELELEEIVVAPKTLSPIREVDESEEFDSALDIDHEYPGSNINAEHHESFADNTASTFSISIEEEDLPKKVKPMKSHIKTVGKTKTENSALKEKKQEICFEIPRQNSLGLVVFNIVRIAISKSFEEVCTIMHREIGCEGVNQKYYPPITLHFSKDPSKKKCPLENEQHWEEVKAEWILEVEKKALAARVVVDLPEKTYPKKMKSTHSKASNKTTTKSGCVVKVAGRAHAPNFYGSDRDTDSAGSDLDNGDDTGASDKWDALLAVLENCNQCNANKAPEDCIPCQINKNGLHKQISHEMIRAWVLALINNEPGVTLKIPPKKDPFLEFHYFVPGASVSSTLGLPTAPVLKIRQNHQEVPQADTDCHAQSLPPVPTYGNPPLCFMPMSKKIMKMMLDGSLSPEISKRPIESGKTRKRI